MRKFCSVITEIKEWPCVERIIIINIALCKDAWTQFRNSIIQKSYI